ncbi:MAG: response regulator [Archangium sp.]|nr:response regulator [Archangium sp.]MDP3570468.1 response regulator [Archangium sp.]
MPRILTVDDSKAIRMIVGKQVAELGFDVDEAEDGLLGLSKLEEVTYDLVILDVTMPNMDGPAMLAKMRGDGNKTPVLMLTSESKKSIMMDVMKAGIEDYILKPFKPEELKAKVLKVLKLTGPVGASTAAAPALNVASLPMRTDPTGKQFIDILVIDDMENVGKKLKTLVPAHVTVTGALSASAAMTLCRDKVFRVVLVDTDIPDVNSAALMNQLRTLQAHAAFLALPLRTTNDVQKEQQALGFDDVIYKPFDKDSIDDFLVRYFNDQELVVADENLVKVGPFTGKEDRIEKYFGRVTRLLEETIEKLAAACFDEVIVDLSVALTKTDRTPRLVLDIKREANKRGIEVKLVANSEVATLLKKFDETAKLVISASVNEARAARAA